MSVSKTKPHHSVQKCICQICTCGRHRCPHNRGSIANDPVPTDARCRLTEYQTAFEKWPYQPVRESHRPAVRPPMDDIAMDMKTIYHETYKEHQPKVDIRTIKYHYNPPTMKMDLASTYTKEYTSKDGRRRKSYKPERLYESSKTPFSSSTMYKENYTEIDPDSLENCRSNPIKHKECIEMSDEPIDGTSIMKKDFIKHDNVKRVGLIQPQRNEVKSKSRFDGNTTYKAEFTRKSPDLISPAPKQDYRPNTSPFSGETTAHSDYKGWPDHKREVSFKPHLVYNPCDVKFDDRTTVSEAFKHWPAKRVEKPQWAHLYQYKPPTAPAQNHSSYQEDYVPPTGCRRSEAVKPQQNEMYFDRNIDGNKMNISTHYQETYKGYPGDDRATSFKKTNIYEEPNEPFLAESCYQANYRGEPCERAKTCGPMNNNLTVEPRSKMRTATTYNEEYKGRSKADCPAKELAKDSEGVATGTSRKTARALYTLMSVTNGHHFYAGEDNTQSKVSARKGSSQVKFDNIATEIGARNSKVKVREENEAKKIARVPTPPSSNTSVKCSCKTGNMRKTKKNVAICTC